MQMPQAETITVQAEVKTCESQEGREKEANGSRAEKRRGKISNRTSPQNTEAMQKKKVLTAVVQI